MEKKCMMVVTAHPDDADFGCSATVAKFSREGWDVVYVICTDGSKGTEDRTITPKELSKIRDNAVKKFDLVDCLIVHRYGRLFVNDKIVLVVCFSEHRNNSFEACKFIMDYLKRDVPFWKKEIYFKGSDWLKNTT